MGLEVIAIALSLALLMAVAYRGLPVDRLRPGVRAAGRRRSRGSRCCPAYTETFMGRGGGVSSRPSSPLFLLGAIFGKLMETGGAAASIAAAIARALGPRRAIPAVVLACAVADVRRRLALRCRLRRLSARGRDCSARPGFPSGSSRRDRPGGVHLHDGRPAGLAADPEPHPDPLLRHRRLRRAARGGSPAAWRS